MKTNLIQSYLNNSTNVQQYNSDNAKKNFDVKKELLNRTFIQPLPSNGHLVKNTIFDYPAECFKDLKYNIKALVHAIKGRANDHELGTINDTGMKLGGLAIATYLLTRRQTPLAKAMEFVGLCSFFGAMEIWPKLALQLPAYLIHGFDIRQQYRDNYNTKKPVFLDHQFIPWDLYSDEEIYKIGDRMGVPKDIKNRRDFIQQKMRKIALQNNTLWMLTSGFATPIMSALICNSLAHPILQYQDKQQEKKALDLLNKFDVNAKNYDFSKQMGELSSILESNKDKNVSKSVYSAIVSNLSQDLDVVSKRAISKDIKRILSLYSSNFDYNEDVAKNMSKAIMNDYASLRLSDDILDKVVPSADDITQKLIKQGLLPDSGTKSGISDFTQILKAISTLGVEKLNSCDVEQSVKDRLKFKASSNNFSHNTNIAKALKSIPSSVLTSDAVERIKNIATELNSLKGHLDILDRYAYLKAGMAPETALANGWNDVVSSDLLKILEISDKDIEFNRLDERLVGDLLKEKFEDIASNKEKYENVVKKLNEKLSNLEEKTRFANININTKDSDTDYLYKKCVDKTFNNALHDRLEKLGMKSVNERLFGYYTSDKASLRNIQLSFVMDRVDGVKGSFYRILNTLDLYRRLATIDTEHNQLFSGMSREIKEELVDMCKEIMLRGHCSDYAEKFYLRRNPDMNIANVDNSQIEVKDGKIINKYIGHRDIDKLADNTHDRIFYERAMKLMYDGALHSETDNILQGSLVYDNFNAWRKNILRIFGGDKYFVKPNHVVPGMNANGATMHERFLNLGNSLDGLFAKLFNNHYNSNKWLKFFAGFGGILLGTTILLQFLFGHMHTDKYEDRLK